MSILRTLVVGVRIHMFFPFPEHQCSVFSVDGRGMGFRIVSRSSPSRVESARHWTGSTQAAVCAAPGNPHPRSFRDRDITGREANYKGSTTVSREAVSSSDVDPRTSLPGCRCRRIGSSLGTPSIHRNLSGKMAMRTNATD